MNDSGVFIAVEGIDGAGKTTQVNLLRDALERVGETVVTSKEPTKGKWGQRLRDSAQNGRLPLDTELEYFLRDREEHLETVVLPALADDKVVIVDRYLYSTIAYQGARRGDFRDLEAAVLSRASRLPDLVLVLDLDPHLALHRIATRDGGPNDFERIENLIAVRAVFNELCRLERDRLRKLDSSISIGALHATAVHLVIDHALKPHRCSKKYGCDDPVNCGFRMSNSCEWVRLRRDLRDNLPTIDADRIGLISA